MATATSINLGTAANRPASQQESSGEIWFTTTTSLPATAGDLSQTYPGGLVIWIYVISYSDDRPIVSSFSLSLNNQPRLRGTYVSTHFLHSGNHRWPGRMGSGPTFHGWPHVSHLSRNLKWNSISKCVSNG